MNPIISYLPRWTPVTGSWITIFIAFLIITPILINQLVPLHDYPHHLARIIILSDLENPIYSLFYKQGSLLLPNQAMEIITLPLTYYMGAEIASRIFVMLSLLSMLFGTIFLHQAVHKRFSPWPLLAIVFLFNGIFHLAMLNYIFGMGMAFIAAGIWLSLKPSFYRLLLSFFMSILLILLHFSAFGIYVVIVGSVEIFSCYQQWQNKDIKKPLLNLLLIITPFIITLCLFMLFSPTAEIIAQKFSYPNFLGAKPFGALYSILTDITWLNIISLSTLALLFLYLFINKRIIISHRLCFAFLMMIIALILLPASMMGNVFVDVRLGPAIAFLFIASIDVKESYLNTNRIVAGVAISLALIISVTKTTQWQKYNQEISEIIAVFDKVEVGSTIFNATSLPDPKLIADTKEKQAAWSPTLKHITSYAVLSGPKFVPMTFADPNMQPLNITENHLAIKAFQGDNPRKVLNGLQLEKFLLEIKHNLTSEKWPKLNYVYVFVMGFDRIEDSFNISNLMVGLLSLKIKRNIYLLNLPLLLKIILTT